MWHPGVEQLIAFVIFLIGPFLGPVLGPIVGGYVIENVGWRWTIWINMIFAGVLLTLQIAAPETYAPILLHRKAKRLQNQGVNVVAPPIQPFRTAFIIAIKRPPRSSPVLC